MTKSQSWFAKINRTLCVPYIDDSGTDASYTVKVNYASAIAEGAKRIGAVKVGGGWYYRAEEVDEVYKVTNMELAQLGAGEIDGRLADYSLWCSQTGKHIARPRKAVLAAL